MPSSSVAALALALLLLTGPTIGQVSVSLSTGNTWTAAAGQARQTVRSGTPLGSGGGVSASDSGACTPTSSWTAASATDCALSSSGTIETVRVLTRANARMPTCGGAVATTGPNVLHVRLQSPVPVWTRVVFAMEAVTFPFRHRVAPASIRVQGTGIGLTTTRGGSIPGPLSVFVPVQPSGTILEVTVESYAAVGLFPNSSDQEALLCLVHVESSGTGKTPQVSTTSIGAPCGPTLAGVVNPAVAGPTRTVALDLVASRLPAGWPASFFVFGVDDIRVPIAPTGCPLRTSILVAVPAFPVETRAILPFWFPPSIGQVDLRAQFLAGRALANGDEWQTSQSLRVVVQ